MKLKNTNFFECHVEKVILSCGVLYALIVVWGYILGQPYTTRIGSDQLSPEQVEQKVLSHAKQLEQKIEPGSASPIETDFLGSAYAQSFRRRLDQPASTAAMINLGSGIAEVTDTPEPDGQRIGPPPGPPPPIEIRAQAGMGVLASHEQLVEQLGEQAADAYATLVDRRQPRDFNYVTVAAPYDMNRWIELLQQSDMPANWWRKTLAFTDVTIERQVYDPETQTGGEIETIPWLPGTVSFRNAPTQWTTDSATQTVKRIKQSQPQILNPPSLPMEEGVSSVVSQLDPLLSMPMPEDPLASQTGNPQDAIALATLIAHDLTVRPGTTYRYRMIVSVLNPQFHREKEKLQDASVSDQLALRSAPGPWSQPLYVEPDTRFFVVSGSAQPQEATVEVWKLFNGAMRVREFRVRPGDVIGATVQMALGDRAFDVDMKMNAIVVDLIENAPGETAEYRGGSRANAIQMLYLEQDTQQLRYRDVDSDRRSSLRKKLKDNLVNPPTTTGNRPG